MFEVNDFEEKWKENQESRKGVLLYIPFHECFAHATIGTGDYLSQEDAEAGFDDSIYVEQLEFIRDSFVEVDSAQLLFKTKEEDYCKNLKHFCDDTMEVLGFKPECEYHVLQLV